MAIRIVRLGSPRAPDEGLRIGTVRRPPRGVKKERHAEDDWYDVWYPELAPAADTVKMGIHGRNAAQFDAFVRAYRREMKEPAPARTIALLAAMSHHANFSVGCYCIDESHCHRSILRELLAAQGAEIVAAGEAASTG
jgi:uncharacterized protein YeaO (DUF488 family)